LKFNFFDGFDLIHQKESLDERRAHGTVKAHNGTLALFSCVCFIVCFRHQPSDQKVALIKQESPRRKRVQEKEPRKAKRQCLCAGERILCEV